MADRKSTENLNQHKRNKTNVLNKIREEKMEFGTKSFKRLII